MFGRIGSARYQSEHGLCLSVSAHFKDTKKRQIMQYKVDDTAEVWKSVKGFEGLYEVSNLGNIRSLPREVFRKESIRGGRKLKGSVVFQEGRNLKPMVSKEGYLFVSLYDINHRSARLLLHRIVAKAFLPNPDNLPCINHKNEIKTDNRAENLEWCTQLYNARYSKKKTTKRLREVLCKRVIQLSLTGIKIAEYSSLREAAEKTGIGVGMISRVAQGERTQTHGYIFKKI